jgi:lipid II:glycine glycyltransferase (peptidoglycan interpeptide bridge formation enzyme)
MVYYRKKNKIDIAEIWYNRHEEPPKKTSIIKYKFVGEKQGGAASLEERFTILIDLKQKQEDIFSQLRKNTRYEINRAKERDRVTCETLFNLGEMDKDKITRFIEYFNAFSDSKKRKELELNFSDLKQFYDNNTLCIRQAVNENESLIYTTHAYAVSDNRARLLYSASHFRDSEDSELRNLIGRANRFLHWADILFFKEMGLDYYDFGGWYGGQEDKEKLAINQFKESFGGEKQREYTYIIPVTTIGKIAEFFHGIIKGRF